MFLEAFHQLLKVVFLQHKQNRRIDHLLITMMKIARDKAFQRLQNLTKGKHTHRLGEINRRHKASLQMTSEIQEYHQSDSDMGWQVQSRSEEAWEGA